MGRLIRSKTALIGVVLLLAALVGVAGVRSVLGEQQATGVVEEQARPLDRLCQTVPGAAAEAGADCGQAARIVADGTAGADGLDGQVGTDGRGVLRTEVTPGGRLVVAYSDGQTVDVGPVVGEAGQAGPEGRGVAGTVVSAGRLVVTFTDGEVLDLGRVVGADGRGVDSLDGSTGRLMVTYTDGVVADAGPLPPGEPGAPGEPGPPGEPAPSQRGAVFVLDDGRTLACQRTGGPDDFPEYRCPTTGPAADGGP